VTAQEVRVEDRASAFIVLRHSQRLEVAPSARLVGNFSGPGDLQRLMGRLPLGARYLASEASGEDLPPSADPELLAVAGALRREIERDGHDPRTRSLLENLASAIESAEPSRLRRSYEELVLGLRSPPPAVVEALRTVRERLQAAEAGSTWS
jgi:hypothetical protein